MNQYEDYTQEQAVKFLYGCGLRYNNHMGSPISFQPGESEAGVAGLWVKLSNGWLFASLATVEYVQKYKTASEPAIQSIAASFKPNE